jgi:hypothetical protein
MLKITPKKKSPVKALFLLSVFADQFPLVPTCHPPKRYDRLDPEECESSTKEFSHQMRGLKITPSSVVGLGAETVYRKPHKIKNLHMKSREISLEIPTPVTDLPGVAEWYSSLYHQHI